MQDINFPKTNVPIISTTTPQENSDQKVLFVGQSDSPPASAELVQNISNSEADIVSEFGAGSMLSRMLINARKLNKICEFDAISVQGTGDGSAADATVLFTGTATEDGTITVTIESSDVGSISFSVSDTDTATVIGDSLVSAIAANTDLDYDAVNTAGSVVISSGTDGVIFNQVSISCSGSVSGVSYTVTGFGSSDTGTDVPANLDSILDLIGEERYQTIVWPYNDSASVDIVQEFLDSRFNADSQVLDGVAIVGVTDTYANLITLVGNYSSQSLVIIGDEFTTASTTDESSAIFESPWVIAAQFGAIRALRRQPNANISDLVISKNGALDSTGGPALSSKPYANTPFSLLPNIGVGRGFTRTEISDLNDAGVSVLGNNRSKTSIVAGQVVTTYVTDPAGNQDLSYKYLNYVDTASTGREYIFNNLQSTYSQSRLTDGNLVKGRDMANSESIAATMVNFYQVLSNEDYVVARKGEDILQYFKENLSVSVDLLTGSVDITFNLPIVTQLREIYAPMTLTFNIE
ncbi:MAG: hypothetical protein K0U78_15175 [Actinomycetia bacterium]|nr:hypothetical protein [Actinomycetes bacterium]